MPQWACRLRFSLSGASVALFVGQAGNLKRQRASQVAGLAAAMIGAAAFIGWWAWLPLLSSWVSGLARTKPLTALCLTALGLALMRRRSDSPFAVGVGFAVTAVAALTVLGVDLGVNAWLVPQGAVLDPGPASSRMMVGMPFAMGPIAGALALSRFEKYHFAAILLAGLGALLPAFGLLTYLAGIPALSGAVQLPPLPSLVGHLCVAAGIILRSGTTAALQKPRPLWQLLVILAWAIITPLLLLAAYTGFRITDAQLDQVRKDLTNEARTLSAEVDHAISGEIERLQALAASPLLRQGDFAAFHRQAEASLGVRRSGNIMLVDRDMRQLVNISGHSGEAAVPQLAARALATDKPQVTGLFMEPEGRQLAFAIIVPVKIDGENRYALIRLTNQNILAGLVAAYELPPGWQAVVSDAAHHVIATSPQEDASVQEFPRAQWHRAEPSGVFEFTDSAGQRWLEAHASSALTGWEAAVWAPEVLIEAPIRATWWTIGLTAALGFSLVLGLALWLGRVIAHSVSHTGRAVIALGAGGPLPSEETPVAEVNALMAELRAAAAKRQAAEDSLRESEAIFRAMFDVSSVGKIETECETGRFLRVNAAMCRFVGYSEAELLSLTTFDITHPDERAPNREQFRRLLAGERDVFDVEKRYIRKDGKAVWARVTANVIRDKSGRPLRSMAVIQDLTARKQAEQALLASKARLQLALDAAQLGWWRYDPVRRASSGDKRANEIFDFDVAENEEVAIEEVVKRVHPDDAERVQAAIATALDPADPKPLTIEYRIRRRDGAVRWVENRGLAYFGSAGPERGAASFVGTVVDVTERKEREEKEHLLMREINHRAKNMLSVVDAIAHQTVARNPEDFIACFSERIQALSANQDLLVRNEWKGVDIADLVRAQLAHFADLIGSRIAMRGPRLRLKPASAQAIGLALHELATNAGKYGALSTDAGRVDVSWGTADGTLTISWSERAGPPVSAPKRRGFGTIVMEMMAERSVGGAVNLDYARSGLTWRLTCPAANALEPAELGQIPGEERLNLSTPGHANSLGQPKLSPV
jgi:PAS domain S-box-containing protein